MTSKSHSTPGPLSISFARFCPARQNTPGEQFVKKKHIVLYGIKPRHPATEYGYIQPGKRINDEIYAVEKFHEKPDAQTTGQYLKAGLLWNSGTFAITPDHLIKELETHAPIYVEKIENYLADKDPYQ